MSNSKTKRVHYEHGTKRSSSHVRTSPASSADSTPLPTAATGPRALSVAQARIAQLESINSSLTDALRSVNRENRVLRRENGELMAKMEELMRDLTELKDAHRKLRHKTADKATKTKAKDVPATSSEARADRAERKKEKEKERRYSASASTAAATAARLEKLEKLERLDKETARPVLPHPATDRWRELPVPLYEPAPYERKLTSTPGPLSPVSLGSATINPFAPQIKTTTSPSTTPHLLSPGLGGSSSIAYSPANVTYSMSPAYSPRRKSSMGPASPYASDGRYYPWP